MNQDSHCTRRRQPTHNLSSSPFVPQSSYHTSICTPLPATGNIHEYARQSIAHQHPVTPAGAYFGPRAAAEPSHSIHVYLLPAPAVAGSAAQPNSPTQDSTSRSALIAFAGALCLGIIAAGYASPNNLKTSRLLVTSVACGIAGCLFTLAALSLDRGRGGQCFLLLSLLSAAVGTVTMVAATQTLEVAIVTSICIVVVAGVVGRLRICAR